MKQSRAIALVIFMCVLASAGCTKSVSCGDATIKMKRNLFNTMVYWLDSPTFSVGETNSVLFQYRNLPKPLLPEMVIVGRTQGRLHSSEQAGRPAYLPLKINVTCLDTNGVAYFSRVVDFSSLKKGNVWPHAQAIPSSAAESDLKAEFDVRIEVVKPSARKKDKAYLHAPLLLPDGFPDRE